MAVLILSVFVGIKLFEFLEDSDFTEFDKPHKMLSFENIKSSFAILSQQVLIYMSEFSFKGMALYVFFAGLIARVVLFFYIRYKNNSPVFYMYLFFSICFDVAVFFAPGLNGNYTGFDTLRYNIYPLYLSALNNTIVIACCVANSRLQHYSQPGKSVSAVLVMILFFTGASLFNNKGLKGYFSYYPEMVQKADAMGQANDLKCGVSDYWNAKKQPCFPKTT